MSDPLVNDVVISGALTINEAEALITRLQKSIEAAKRKPEEAKRDAQIVPGGLYLDQHGTAYLAVNTAPGQQGQIHLWRLRAGGATHASPAYWRLECGVELRPIPTGWKGSTQILMADGSRVDR